MQYILLAYDAKDKDAAKRRLDSRDAHLSRAKRFFERGKLLYGVALFDDSEKVIGSCMIFDFDSKGELDVWLEEEPYLLNKVWETVEITKCKVGPMFER